MDKYPPAGTFRNERLRAEEERMARKKAKGMLPEAELKRLKKIMQGSKLKGKTNV